MNTMDYEALLKKSWDDVPEPRDLPSGSWVLDCKSAKIMPPKDEKGGPVALFTYEPVEPCGDVSDSELAELGEGYDFASNTLFKRFRLENVKDVNRLRQHLVQHGLDLKDFDNIEESVAACKNIRVTAYLQYRVYTTKQGETRTDADLVNFALDDE